MVQPHLEYHDNTSNLYSKLPVSARMSVEHHITPLQKYLCKKKGLIPQVLLQILAKQISWEFDSDQYFPENGKHGF